MMASTTSAAMTTATNAAAPATTTTAPPSPSAFLSPSITAELDKSLDAIEDLFLDGGGDGASSSPLLSAALSPPPTAVAAAAAAAAAAAPTTATNDKATGADEVNPTTVATTAPPPPNRDYRAGNAVHMEVQENAKLPTFHFPVDRSNASWHVPAPRGRRSRQGVRRQRSSGSLAARRPRSMSGDGSSCDSVGIIGGVSGVTCSGGAAANSSSSNCPLSPIPKLRQIVSGDESSSEKVQLIDEIMRLNENDINLSEMFLDGDDRSSAALAYSFCAGGMPRLDTLDVAASEDGKTTSTDETAGKNNGPPVVVRNNGGVAPRSSVRQPPRPNAKSLPLYRRREPLPIPTLKRPSPSPSKTGSNALTPAALAIATAAAIAKSTSPTSTVSVGVPGGMDERTAAALSVQLPTTRKGGAGTGADDDRAMVTSPATKTATTTKVATSITTATTTTRPSSARAPPPPATAKMPHPPLAPPHPPLAPPPPPPGSTPPTPAPPSLLPPPPTSVAVPKQPGFFPFPTRPGPNTRPRPTGPPLILPPYPPGGRHPPYANAAALEARAKARKALHAATAAHGKPSKVPLSIARAAAQRSKFGFGGDHRVPSVPAPPPNVRGYPKQTMEVANGPTTAAGKSAKSMRFPLAFSARGAAARGRPAPAPVPPAAMAGKSPPAPPPSDLLYKPPGMVTPPVPPPKSTGSAAPASADAPPTPGGLPKDVGSIIAYERKKQRAKDARIKLNEAIEELAVAIDLAGSQSKERYDYMTKVTGSVNVHVTPADGESAQHTAPQHPLARLMNETIQQASEAKKWDRPSFVRLSSTIIRSLNAQCEGLTREVAQLRSLVRRSRVPANGGGPPGAMIASLGGITLPQLPPSPANVVNGVHGRSPPNGIHAVGNQETTLLPGHPAAKKQKLENSDPPPCPNSTIATARDFASPLPSASSAAATTTTKHQRQISCLLSAVIRDTVETPSLLERVASFLDPASLLQCRRVSKRWNSRDNAFRNPELWLRLSISRFGASAVRTWQDAHDDEDEEEEVARPNATKISGESGAADTAATAMDYVSVYCRMSERNVRPSYFPTMIGEGSVILGGSTLDGLVGGWATLVERSNGETSRSVLRQKTSVPGETTTTRQCCYGPMPVVELRLLVQNTGYSKGAIILPAQEFSVDASTRRKGEKFSEVGDGDERFRRRVLRVESDGSTTDYSESSSTLTLEDGNRPQPPHSSDLQPQNSSLTRQDMCCLRLYESAIVSLHIHARGCSTTAKFRGRSKRMQILVCVDGTTRPLAIPFHAEDFTRS